MKSFLLQEFVPDGAPAHEPRGETLDQQLARARAEGHAAGVREGAEASAAAHAESQETLRAELVETLRDHRIRRHEAQAAAMNGAGPVLAAALRRLAPRLAETGLAEHLAAALDEALRRRPEPVPVIRCAAESARGLERALADRAPDFLVETDPRLTPLEVELHWQDGFDAIDMNSVIAAMEQALESALAAYAADPMEKEQMHG